ncbi:amino acid deaminase [Labrys sp. KNU-23]|uniref:alanine racemase n=1 Tax=Labrys sp. KNU-23 TaxID=2789216 RepID=UPI0011EFA9E2|nr:alanine racemase [Labrys sp. KNU-23]QEN90966.1 amino acid deaminase [Labrys sp. KNU-23]
MSDLHLTLDAIDDRMRGFPAGHAPLPLAEIGRQGWKPYDGTMSLPLISLDRSAFDGNVALMMRYVRDHGVAIAPHAKTPMSTALARGLVEAGAWGTTVADIRQASVLLKAGFDRLILANEIGGPAAAGRLAALLAGHPEARLHVFVDSPELAAILLETWRSREELPPLGLLLEVGAGRAGARTIEAAQAVLDTILAGESAGISLSGIGAYEGAAATVDPEESIRRIDELMALTVETHRLVRDRIGTERSLILTAGGSVFFDRVIAHLRPINALDAATTLVLRSGAIFFHDHGVYERGLAALDARSGFEISGETVSASIGFKPVLRIWAEVLSRPEPDLAICGMGLRDVAMDQGLPRPLALYREGRRIGALDEAAVARLNDQHAFVTTGGGDLRIGDVIEFGLSHPCTCLDRHALVYGLDADSTVIDAFATSFG